MQQRDRGERVEGKEGRAEEIAQGRPSRGRVHFLEMGSNRSAAAPCERVDRGVLTRYAGHVVSGGYAKRAMARLSCSIGETVPAGASPSGVASTAVAGDRCFLA